jgi:hypothetical protein
VSLALSGRAGELFERWKAHCTDTTRWTIPPGGVHLPEDLVGDTEGVRSPEQPA